MLRRPIARVRERMVLDEVRSLLEGDERVSVWAHVRTPVGDRPGLLSLTTERCLVHWSARADATAIFRWSELTAWELTPRRDGATVLRLTAGSDRVEVGLALTTDARARTATEIVDHVSRHAPPVVAPDAEAAVTDLSAEPRGLRAHARRVGVTLLGVLVILISVVFASPFVPGPGSLTFLAGLAILAKEYDWARDVDLWVRRKFEQLWVWLKARRERRRARHRQRQADRASSVVPRD